MKLIMENWRQFIIESDYRSRAVYMKARDNTKYAYIFGTVSGKVLEAKNETDMYYGASMPKPIMALAHMKKFRNAEEGSLKKLTDEELKGLLNYVGYGAHASNAVNKRIIAKVSDKEATDFIASTGIASNISSEEHPMGQDAPRDKSAAYEKDVKKKGRYITKPKKMTIKRGSFRNKQTPLQFFNFLTFLYKTRKMFSTQSHADPQINEFNKIMSIMRRDYFGVNKRDRENQGFEFIKKYLNHKGIKVSKVYGKGGRAAGSLNYGIIIDDKWIFSIYTDFTAGAWKPKKTHEKDKSKRSHWATHSGPTSRRKPRNKYVKIIKIGGERSEVGESKLRLVEIIAKVMSRNT